MKSNNYLSLGLTGLARCHSEIWDAHFPAAVLAGHFFIENNNLSVACENAIKGQIELIIAHKPELFLTYEDSNRAENPSDILTGAIENSIDTFSELGHNTIFLHYALRVLEIAPHLATEEQIHDLATLIHNFKCGPAMLWIKLGQGHGPKVFRISESEILKDSMSASYMAEVIFRELCEFDFIYTQMGSKSHIGHLITQSQSLIELKRMGFASLASRGLNSLETRLLILRDFRGYEAPKNSYHTPASYSKYSPFSENYWKQDFTLCKWDEGHCLKYTYSFYELANLIEDKALVEKATERFRYLITPNERSKPR